jgi:hypothetical protein
MPPLIPKKKTPKITLPEARQKASAQYTKINTDMVKHVCSVLDFDESVILALLKTLKLKIDTKRVYEVLNQLRVGNKTAMHMAVSKFMDMPLGPDGENTTVRLLARFTRFLINEEESVRRDYKDVDLSSMTKVMPGMTDEIDDRISNEELKYQLGDLADE